MSARILVVDDAAFMRMIIKDILKGNGFEIAGEAENGRQAVASYEELLPDLVTMDITMPEMNGIDAARTICANHPGAKILMVSAMGQQTMVVEALEAGASDFIVKPFQPAKVLEIVNKCLADTN